jgi:hypothetical protein
MAFLALPQRRPTLIIASDREVALVKAYEWIEARLASDEDPT